MIHLKEANFEDIEKEYLFVKEMPYEENGFFNEWKDVSREDFAEKAIKQMIDYSKGVGLPEGYVPETIYFLWDDKEIVGQFHIRHYLCESLREGAGHIGYFVDKKYRGRGYATEGLRLTLEKARQIVPEDEIYLRTDRTNHASLRVMQKNGGQIHHKDENKYYVRIKK